MPCQFQSISRTTFWAVDIGIVAAILIGLNQALVRAGWPESQRASAMQGVGGTLLGFLVFAVVLASLEVYRTAPDQLPVIPLGILLPILVGGIVLQRSHLLQRVIDAVPQSWLVAIQFYRALGVIFLILYASNKLPGLFAWPAGVGDIAAVGLLAPTVALAYARDPEMHRHDQRDSAGGQLMSKGGCNFDTEF